MFAIFARTFIAILGITLLAACDSGGEPILRGKKSDQPELIERISERSSQLIEDIAIATGLTDEVVAQPVKGSNNTHQSVSLKSVSKASVEDIPAVEKYTQSSSKVTSANPSSEKQTPVRNKNTDQYIDEDRLPLDLSLPAMSWNSPKMDRDERKILPNVFKPLPMDKSMNLGGRLHWDESEEAKQRSVEETLQGAEVELKFYLP